MSDKEKNNEILVFLSRPNPFLEEHEVFLTKLKSKLQQHSIRTITLAADNYDITDSITYLKGMIRQCYGVVVVGFKQIFIDKGSKKRGGLSRSDFFHPEEIDVSGQALTSPFCHIEGTIALVYDLPMLIINEKGIREEGIISSGKFNVKCQSFDLSDSKSFFENDIVDKQIAVWVGQVTERYLFLNLNKI